MQMHTFHRYFYIFRSTRIGFAVIHHKRSGMSECWKIINDPHRSRLEMTYFYNYNIRRCHKSHGIRSNSETLSWRTINQSLSMLVIYTCVLELHKHIYWFFLLKILTYASKDNDYDSWSVFLHVKESLAMIAKTEYRIRKASPSWDIISKLVERIAWRAEEWKHSRSLCCAMEQASGIKIQMNSL